MGAEVEIEGSVNAAGRVFRIEEEQTQLPNNGGQTVRHRLTLVTANGFVQAILEDVRALRFTDPQLRAQIDRALTAIAQNRAKDQRTISINLGGQGERRAGFSYVVAAPVWKTAYRLVLPKEGEKARLQGWGVLENLTGGEWKDVELTLVSGNPVALKQPLYSAVFVDRPEIPVSASARIVPRKDDQTGEDRLDQALAREQAAPRQKSASRSIQGFAAAAPAPQAAFGGAYDRLGNLDEQMGSAAVKAEAEDAATQNSLPLPLEGYARLRRNHDGAIRGPGHRGVAHLSLPARNQSVPAACRRQAEEWRGNGAACRASSPRLKRAAMAP